MTIKERYENYLHTHSEHGSGDPLTMEQYVDYLKENDPKFFKESKNEENQEAPSELQIRSMLQQVGNVVRVLEQEWEAYKKEFNLTDSNMKDLYQYNSEHAVPMPEGLSEAEQEEWDYFNGLNEMTEEDAVNIFGKDSPIIGTHHSVTLDRIKYVTTDFFKYTQYLNEYTKIHNAYMDLIEERERAQIKSLEIMRDKEEDPKKKEALDQVIKNYWYRKNLDFLREPLDEKLIQRLTSAYFDSKKISYWMNRCRDKLSQLKISQKFILEISQFEKRFMNEKYHKISNMFLLYFMHITTFCDTANKNDINRTNVVCIVNAMDSYIRNSGLSDDERKHLIENISMFLDQFVDRIPDPETKKED